jgi:hypothetical protein
VATGWRGQKRVENLLVWKQHQMMMIVSRIERAKNAFVSLVARLVDTFVAAEEGTISVVLATRVVDIAEDWLTRGRVK